MPSLSRIPRLYVDAPLGEGATVTLARNQCHYLITVMRLREGDAARLFNGRDGEWLTEITDAKRKSCALTCREKIADAAPPPDIDYLFAPLKAARLDYMVQKATEMGARRIRPVFTTRTIAKRVNLERMRANVIEAAEQCNLVWLPEVLAPLELDALLDGWDASRRLIFCDEAAPVANPVKALRTIPPGPLALLIGPEGGFTDEERARLHELDFVHAISLGPRVMRADTAAVAALALVQSTLGDWT